LNKKDQAFFRNSVYLVTDTKMARENLGSLEQVLESALFGGIRLVQYREKNFQYSENFAEAKRVRDLAKGMGALFLVNDRVDLCLGLDADGVHLGQSDMPPGLARKILGPEKVIGLSIETEADWEDWKKNYLGREIVDYLALSPIFSTPTKTDTISEWGLTGLRKMKKEMDGFLPQNRIPIVAIGGIHSENIREVSRAGADCLAVVSGICASSSPRQAAEKLIQAILDT
jgi:thiamine-phosphate pyrophosphorylase